MNQWLTALESSQRAIASLPQLLLPALLQELIYEEV
jgi:hypothetical protein